MAGVWGAGVKRGGERADEGGVKAPPTGPYILICDDEAPIRQVVRARLQSAGYQVAEARTGAEGLDIAVASAPSLIISDYQMPVMSGVEMARQLRGVVSTAEVPILLVTARGYVLDPAELAGTMIRAVMGKPFGLRQLQEQVAGLLGEGGARKVA